MGLPSFQDSNLPARQIATLAQLEELFDQQAAGERAAAVGFLLALSGPTAGKLYVVNKLEQVIGRSKYADVRIDEKAVSQKHAKLVLAGEGYRLVDLGSTNGTYVNDSRIDEHELQSGDTLRIGQTVMAYLTSGDRDDSERTVMLDRLGPSLPALPARGGFEALEPRGINLPSADEGMSLSDLIGKLIGVWGFIRRYWPWLVALPILFGAMGLSTLRLIPPKESASFTVNFVPAPARNPVERSWERPPNGGPFEFFRMPERTFLSPELIRETLTGLGEPDASEARIKEVGEQLEFKNVGPQIWQGSFVHPSAAEAESFLKAHVDHFLDHELDLGLKVIRAEVDFLTKQLKETEAQLSKTENELREFKEKHLTGLPEQAREQFSSMFSLKDRQRELSAELERIRAELKLRREKLSSKDPMLEQRVAATEPYKDAIANVRRQIAEAKSSGLGEQHPRLLELRQQEKRLQGLSSRLVSSGSSEVDERASTSYIRIEDEVKALKARESVAQKELGRVSGDIASIERVVQQLPEVEARHAQLSRSYDGTKELHARLFQELQKAQLQLELERASAEAHYNIIDPPTAEPASLVKHGAMRGGAGVLLGLVIAILIGGVSELRIYVRRYLAEHDPQPT